MVYFYDAKENNLETNVEIDVESDFRVFDISTSKFWQAKENRSYDANDNISENESFYFFDSENKEIDDNTLEKIIH